MKEERNIITMDERGNISLPSDIGATAMTEREICELFGVIAPTVRVGIKALCKSGVLCIYDIKRIIRLSDKYSAEVYNLETIAALAFRVESFGAAKSAGHYWKGLYTGEKRKRRYSCRLFRTASPTAVGKHDDISAYQHINMQTYHYGDIYCRFYSSFQRKAEQIISVYKGKASTGFMSAKRSGGCAVSR